MFNFFVIDYTKTSPACPGPNVVYTVVDVDGRVFLTTCDKDKAYQIKDELEAKNYSKHEE